MAGGLAVDEQQRLDAWRVERYLTLTRGSIRLSDAWYLADKQVSPHELDRLLKQGCPLATALRILR